MKKILSIVLSVVFIVGTVCISANAESEMPFRDVKEKNWFYSAVKEAYSRGIMGGVSDTEFSPNGELSRAMLVTILGRMAGAGKTDFSPDTFPDTKKSTWYSPYVGWAMETGLVGGYEDGTFRPDAPVKRQELAKIVVLFIEKQMLTSDAAPLIEKFADSDSFAPWSAEYVEKLRKTGLVGGDSQGNFNPKSPTTRAEFATILMRFPTEEIHDPTGATPDNIGVEFEDESGIRISYLRPVEDESGPIWTCGTGMHGGHETRVVRTENGTYCTYIMNETTSPTAEHPLWCQGVAEVGVIKVTSGGFKLIYSFEFPRSESSNTPNILRGKNGTVYITNIADDKDKYMTALNKGYLQGGAWLDMYVLDTNTDTVVHKASARPDFDTSPAEDHGYGKSQPILDLEHGRIIALYNGGDAPGFFAWFIYDIEKGEWEETCHTIRLPERRDYINGYPDGHGGFTFVIQRTGTVASREKSEGIDFKGGTYLHDGILIYNIPDPYGTEYTEKIVRFCEYSKTEANSIQTMNHYGIGGCTYKDNKGNIHIIYTEQKKSRNTTYHAIYDKDLNEVLNEPIVFSAPQSSYSNKYSFVMTQGKSGRYYIIAENMYGKASKEAGFEIWSSDDGINFTSQVERHVLKTLSGESLPGGYLTVASTRCNSVMDGIAAILFDSTIDGKFCFCFAAVELP